MLEPPRCSRAAAVQLGPEQCQTGRRGHRGRTFVRQPPGWLRSYFEGTSQPTRSYRDAPVALPGWVSRLKLKTKQRKSPFDSSWWLRDDHRRSNAQLSETPSGPPGRSNTIAFTCGLRRARPGPAGADPRRADRCNGLLGLPSIGSSRNLDRSTRTFDAARYKNGSTPRLGPVHTESLP